MRCIRSQRSNLITGLPEEEINSMSLGLAHRSVSLQSSCDCKCLHCLCSLSRYKLKFSPDKVDTMVIQAISESLNISSSVLFLYIMHNMVLVNIGG